MGKIATCSICRSTKQKLTLKIELWKASLVHPTFTSDGVQHAVPVAEVDDFEDGYIISSPEEMALVFEFVTEAKKFDLEIYDFS